MVAYSSDTIWNEDNLPTKDKTQFKLFPNDVLIIEVPLFIQHYRR